MGNRLFENAAFRARRWSWAQDADEFHRFVAEELQAHLRTAERGAAADRHRRRAAPRTRSTTRATLILVGGPDANAAVRRLTDLGARSISRC